MNTRGYALPTLGLLLLLACVGPAEAAKRALIIGVNDYRHLPTYSVGLGRTMPDLKGPVNDARGIADALQAHFGFGPADIKTLTNEQASRDAILAAFRDWLINGTTVGDVVVFYFSGHGTVVPDANADEDDGLDEALVPYDLVPTASTVAEARLILDDELGALVAQLRGRSVVVIVDACHSGTMTRSVGRQVVSDLEHTPGRGPAKVVWLERLNRTRGARRELESSGTPWARLAHQIVLTSSRAQQVSVEIATPSGAFYGAFTSALLERMKQAPTPSYRELFTYARDVVRDRYGLPQEAQLQPQQLEALDLSAFDPFVPMSRAQAETGVPSRPPPSASGPTPESRPPAGSVPEMPPYELGNQVLLRIEALDGASSAQNALLRETLAALPYVQLTEGAFFDRLLRGRVSSADTHEVRLLNKAGDAMGLPAVGSAQDLLEQVAPHLEYAYLVKQLANIWTPAPAFRVELTVAEDRRDFHLGETVVFEITPERDCYVLLYNVDSMGNAHLVFPNQYSRDNFVSAGMRVQLPSQSMRRNQFEFQFFPPAGEETFKLIATNQPLDLGRVAGGDPARLTEPASGDPLAATSPSRDLTESLLAAVTDAARTVGFRWSEDMVVLRSHAQ